LTTKFWQSISEAGDSRILYLFKATFNAFKYPLPCA